MSVSVQVRVFGTDRDGKVFSQNATTLDVSQHGVRIRGMQANVKVDEIIGVTYGANKAHFKVKWVGAAGTPTEGSIGLLNLNPQKPFWDFPLREEEIDTFLAQRNRERRRWPRVKCAVSVEVRMPGQPVIWGKASDLSQGGCFIEMAIPLPLESKFDLNAWLGESKILLKGQVASVAPGFGNGVRFLGLTPANQEHLARFIESIIPQERRPFSELKRFGA